jgi:hypothetical protein
MGVPDLDWPAELFADAIPRSESSPMISTRPEDPPDTDVPLWSIMHRLCMRRSVPIELRRIRG